MGTIRVFLYRMALGQENVMGERIAPRSYQPLGDLIFDLLPAIPMSGRGVEFSGIRARGGFEVAIGWSNDRFLKYV